MGGFYDPTAYILGPLGAGATGFMPGNVGGITPGSIDPIQTLINAGIQFGTQVLAQRSTQPGGVLGPPAIPATGLPTSSSPLVIMGGQPITSVTSYARAPRKCKRHKISVDAMGQIHIGKCVRRMNPLNPRALRRAIKRAHGFERFARKALSFPFHKKALGRGVFKKRKKA